MKKKVLGFRGQFRFLSNFWPSVVKLDEVVFPTVEHAYQFSKSLDPDFRQKILECETPGKVKRLSKMVILREDWEQIKLLVMEDLLRQKFQHPELKALLLGTEDWELIEDNWWGDVFWGVCKGVGQNHLGLLLMKIRDEFRE